MTVDAGKLAKLKEIVENNQCFAIFGHKNIDGDAIGWSLGLWGILEKLGKDVKYFTTIKPAKTYSFVEWVEKISTDFDYADYDVLICVDFTPLDRISEFVKGHEDYFAQKDIVIIDHHYGNPPENAVLVIRDEDATSNCEWVFEHVREIWPELIDEKIATYFYLGLTTDSANFIHDEPNQSARTLENAVKLIELWANKKMIVDNVFRKKTLASVEFMQQVLGRMKVYKHNILVSYCSFEELDEKNLDSFEAGYALPIMQSIEWIELIIFCKYSLELGTMRMSFRGRWKYEVNKLAENRWGGGHHNAAGTIVHVPNRDFQKKILEVVDTVIKMTEN